MGAEPRARRNGRGLRTAGARRLRVLRGPRPRTADEAAARARRVLRWH